MAAVPLRKTDGGRIEEAPTDALAEIFMQIEKARPIKDYTA